VYVTRIFYDPKKKNVTRISLIIELTLVSITEAKLIGYIYLIIFN